MSKLRKTPPFKTEADERAFWESHDSSDYVDWTKAQSAAFPKLNPSTSDAISPDLGLNENEEDGFTAS